MKKTGFARILSLILCISLLAATAIFCIGCKKGQDTTKKEEVTSAVESNAVGEGKTEFEFRVTFKDGHSKSYRVRTDEKTVGAALLGVKLIAGDDGPYGLYVKTVDGETVDYEKDGKYWAFLIDGKMAPAGVDQTNVEEGHVYSFEVQ